MFVVDRRRIIISRNAAHLQIPYDINPSRPSDRVQEISIQSTVVTIPLSVSVCEIEVSDKEELSRKCFNHEGSSVDWETVPWALACQEQEVACDFRRYLDQHAQEYARMKGPWVGALERLASENNSQYADLLNNQRRLSLAEDWKLGSASYTDPLPGDVQIPSNWETLPGLYALPRKVVIGLNWVFDQVIQPIFDAILSQLKELELNPESLHIIYLLIRIWSTHIDDVIQDKERRKGAGAPGSSDTSLEHNLQHSRELLCDAFSSAVKQTNITFVAIINDLPPEIGKLHEND